MSSQARRQTELPFENVPSVWSPESGSCRMKTERDQSWYLFCFFLLKYKLLVLWKGQKLCYDSVPSAVNEASRDISPLDSGRVMILVLRKGRLWLFLTTDPHLGGTLVLTAILVMESGWDKRPWFIGGLAMGGYRGALFSDTHLRDFASKMWAQGKTQVLWAPLDSYAVLQPLAGLKVPLRLVPGIC